MKVGLLEVYDDRLHFLAKPGALLLDESLRLDDVSRAWLVWSGAEAALADAYRFAGSPVSGPVWGRGSVWFRVVRLAGPEVRKARSDVADVHEACDVFKYLDSSIAFLLDLRSCLSCQSVRDGGIGEFRRVAGDLHCRRTDFVIVGMRLFVGGGTGYGRTLLFSPSGGSGMIWSPAPFLQCEPHLTHGGSGSLLIQLGLIRNSERLGFPIFVALGKGRPALRNSLLRLMVGCQCFLWYLCLS